MRYRVLAGLSYRAPDGTPRRAEPGQVVGDLPVTSVGWLLARGDIEDAPEPEPEALPLPRRKRTTKGGE
ncbi:hypothetical protein [Nocardiopsis dassonvillei]|uniref:hypothetical protein n=1 Tax=Nocardiopsis dassonvillei TaxID=2014 RepID=UPI003635744E